MHVFHMKRCLQYIKWNKQILLYKLDTIFLKIIHVYAHIIKKNSTVYIPKLLT